MKRLPVCGINPLSNAFARFDHGSGAENPLNVLSIPHLHSTRKCGISLCANGTLRMADQFEVLRALMRQTEPYKEPINPVAIGLGNDIRRNADSVAQALAAPGNAARGLYDYVEVSPNGEVAPFNGSLLNAANNMAGVIPLGSMFAPRPKSSLGSGGRPSNLPFSDSLDTPPIPTQSQMGSMGRVESVPIQQARATNSLQWDKFNAGEHPPELVPGYADKPVAIRKENGEYIIVDGHHRTSLAAQNGAKALDMYVIDAKDYAPQSAGRKPRKSDISDDELMRALGF